MTKFIKGTALALTLTALTTAGAQTRRLPEGYASFFRETAAPAMTSLPAPPPFATPPLKAEAASGIYGYLFYFNGSNLQQGLYSIAPSTGATYLWSDYYTSNSMPMMSGWLRNGTLNGLNAMSLMGGYLFYGQVEIDMTDGDVINWIQLRNDNDVSNMYLTNAYRILDDHVYGYGPTADGQSYAFKIADADNIDTTEILKEIDMEEVCTALCYNVQDDMFYGVNYTGKFVKVDTKGNQTELFDLGITNLSTTLSGIVYSASEKAYIFNAYLKNNSSAMYSIDPVAKKATKLMNCSSGQEYIFMVTTEVNADSDAPAKAVLDSYLFDKAALSGTAAFTIAGKTVGGSSLSGSLDWRLLVDGNQLSTGTTTAGSKQTVSIPAVTNGMHTFAFAVAKDGNYSEPTTFTTWVGSDYPKAPENLVLTETKLTWDAVTEGVHGGYIDAASVRYEVTLNDETVTTTSSTSCTIALPQGKPFTTYTARVRAIADNKQSEDGVSNFITYGQPLEIAPGLHFTPTEEQVGLFTFVDLDGKLDSEGNPRNWHYSTTMGFPSFASGADGDDLLIFPPINLSDTEHAYRFEMEAGLIRDIDVTGTLEVILGREPKLESMTQVIVPERQFYHMAGDIIVEYFGVKEPGTYYIGIRAKSHDVAFHVSDIDLQTSTVSNSVPSQPSALSGTASADGAKKAIVTFTMPEKTVTGVIIDADTELTAKITAREFVPFKPSEGEVAGTTTVRGKPGETVTATVDTHQGTNTIGVCCSQGGNYGAEATMNLYTGLYKPYRVENFKGEVSEDNMTLKLSWTPPVESSEMEPGLPIGDTFYYTVWYYSNGWTHLANVGWDILSYDVELPADAAQNLYTIGVMALNDAGQSDYINYSGWILGPPYKLPMNETFAEGDTEYWPIMTVRPDNSYQGTDWTLEDPAMISEQFANRSGIALVGYIGQDGITSAKARLGLPKFSTEDSKVASFTLSYWGGPNEAPMSLYAETFGSASPVKIATFPTGKGWMTNTVAIPAEFLGKKWMQLLIDAEFSSPNNFAIIDSYSIAGPSLIEGIGAEGSIFAAGGMIHVAGFAGQPLTITDMSGRNVAESDKLQDINGFAVAPGIYIVKAGSTVRKVAVK